MIASYLEKYKKLSLPLRAGFWFAVSGILQKSIAFVTLPIFTRLLTPEEYGIVTIFNSWESILLLLVSLNVFYGAFNTAMMDFENERDAYASSLVSLMMVFGIFWFLIYLIFKSQFDSLMELPFLMVCVMFIQVISQGVVSIWLARCKFSYEYVSVVITTIVLFGLSPVLSILGIELFPCYRVEAKVIGNAMAFFISGCYAAFVLFHRSRHFFTIRHWVYAIGLSSPLLIHYLSAAVLGQSDRILIGKFTGESNVAIYAVAYSVGMMFSIVTTSACQAIVPRLFECIKTNELKKMNGPITIMFCIVVVSLSLLMLIGPEIIMVLAPSEYHEASNVIPPIMAGLFFTFIYQVFSNVEFYYKKISYIVLASVLTTTINFGLNYVFIPLYGFKVSAYTTLLCSILYGFTHFLLSKKTAFQNGLYWPFSIKDLFFMGILLLFLTTIVLQIYQLVLLRYIIIATIGTIIVFNHGKILSFANRSLRENSVQS
jgi:O-antigen/teichoic acid export membrane protein